MVARRRARLGVSGAKPPPDATETVYEYEIFDRGRMRWRRADRMGTAGAIERAGGIPVRSSALVVAAARLDEWGFVRTPAGG